ACLGNFDRRDRLLGRRRQKRLELFFHLFGHGLGAAAFRIIATAEEWTSGPAFHDHCRAALGTLLTRLNRLHRITFGVDILGISALGIAGASQERSASAFAQHHRLAALLADMFGGLAAQDRLAFGIEVHGRLAIRVAAASEERPAPSHALEHGLAALGAGVIGG